MCLINITCDFSRLDFSGVSRSVNTITIAQSTHTCYSLFQTCACISLVTGRCKPTAWRESIYFLHFTLRTWLQCQRYAAILGHGLVAIPLPPYFEQPLRMKRHNHSLALRQIYTAVNYFWFSFFPSAVIYWNRLPAQVVLLPTLGQFSVAVRLQDHLTL